MEPAGGNEFFGFNNMAMNVIQGGLMNEGNIKNVESKISKFFSFGPLRYYFTVSSTYVQNKLKHILLPYLHTRHNGRWERNHLTSENGTVEYVPPRDDINAPDLYIPLMAYATYIILCGIIYGLNSAFKPDLLSIEASKGCIFIALEVLIVKLGFYLLSNASISILECLSYCGYIFVGVCLDMIGGIILGKFGYFAMILFTSCGIAYYIGKVLNVAILKDSSVDSFDQGMSPQPDPMDMGFGMPPQGYNQNSVQASRTKKYFVAFVCVLQFVVAYFLAIRYGAVHDKAVADALAAAKTTPRPVPFTMETVPKI